MCCAGPHWELKAYKTENALPQNLLGTLFVFTTDCNLDKILCSKIYLCSEDVEGGGKRREALEDKGVVVGWRIKETEDNGEVGRRLSRGTLEDDSRSSMWR